MIRTEAQVGKTTDIGLIEHTARKLLTGTLTSTIFRTEKTEDTDGIKKAKETLQQGHGLVILINHFSLKEPPITVLEVFRQREMDNKRVIAPIAYHMDRRFYHLLGRLAGYKLFPIVTKNTVREEKNDGHELGEGKGKYVMASLDLLRQGGIVILAPQETRMSHLGQPEKSVASLMLAAKRDKIGDFSFLFIGFGIEGVSDYSNKRIRGFPFEKYQMHIGTCLTNQELLKKAEGNYKKVDEVVYEELGKLVPASYR